LLLVEKPGLGIDGDSDVSDTGADSDDTAEAGNISTVHAPSGFWE
jgi:hypothetical protein